MTRRLFAGCLGVLGAGGRCAAAAATPWRAGTFLPDYSRPIGVPLFQNNTTVFEIEQSLTQQVRTEFIGRGRYRVVAAETGVDALLTGTISRVTIAPASFTAQQQASRYIFTVQAAMEFRDLTTDEVLWENPSLSLQRRVRRGVGRRRRDRREPLLRPAVERGAAGRPRLRQHRGQLHPRGLLTGVHVRHHSRRARSGSRRRPRPVYVVLGDDDLRRPRWPTRSSRPSMRACGRSTWNGSTGPRSRCGRSSTRRRPCR